MFIYLLLFQGSTSLSAQQQQLQQLQLLQQQLIQQTQLMQQSTGQQPVIDNNLLSHIQTLTSQLLNKKPPEPGFNKVYRNNSYNLCSSLFNKIIVTENSLLCK